MHFRIGTAIGLASLGGLIAAFQNCSKMEFEQLASQSPTQSLETEQPPPPVAPNEPATVYDKCRSASLKLKEVNVSFGKDTRQCGWGSNGNLEIDSDDMHFQARREQTHPFTLPAGATMCKVEFDFAEQTFKYDDHFIFTLNNAILATSYPWVDVDDEDKLVLNRKNGFLIYDWSRIAGLRWVDAYNGITCAGSDDGLSDCSWPATDTLGKINMSFEPKLIQDIMTMNQSSNDHEFKFVVTGDNDARKDCQHEPIAFTANVYYAL